MARRISKTRGGYSASLRIDGQTLSVGAYPTRKAAFIAQDRAILHSGIDEPLKYPKEAKKLGPATVEQLQEEAYRRNRHAKGKYIGVVRQKSNRTNPYSALIYIEGKLSRIADFADPLEAAEAYDRVAKKLHGKEARLNFPHRRFRAASIEEVRARQRKVAKKTMSSRYRGVCLETASGRWLAYIRTDDGVEYLGRYYEEKDAARAYDKAARRLHGRKAEVNLPRCR